MFLLYHGKPSGIEDDQQPINLNLTTDSHADRLLSIAVFSRPQDLTLLVSPAPFTRFLIYRAIIEMGGEWQQRHL
jgi:hypothetical protein